MKAYKCDRCGQLFENKASYEKYVIKNHIYNGFFDLCEECQNELEEWMDKFNKNINGESEE